MTEDIRDLLRDEKLTQTLAHRHFRILQAKANGVPMVDIAAEWKLSVGRTRAIAAEAEAKVRRRASFKASPIRQIDSIDRLDLPPKILAACHQVGASVVRDLLSNDFANAFIQVKGIGRYARMVVSYALDEQVGVLPPYATATQRAAWKRREQQP